MNEAAEIAPVETVDTRAAPSRSSAADLPGLRALIAEPEDRAALDAFLSELALLDPRQPRKSELTLGLKTALAAPVADVKPVEAFVVRRLYHELEEAGVLRSDQATIPTDTLSLIATFLFHRCNTSLALETVLIAVRRQLLLLSEAGHQPAPELVHLAEAMARHSFFNEYIWDVTADETARIDTLAHRVTTDLASGAKLSAFDLFLIGAYRPLDAISEVRQWVLALHRQAPAELDPTLQLLVLDRAIEDALEFERLTPVQSEVSVRVQQQYEENPYPRWRHLFAATPHNRLPAYLAQELEQTKVPVADGEGHLRVLVAGGGTGRHPIYVAQSLPQAAVLAIDLSRASLAYATRQAAAQDITNLAFGQADILGLDGVDTQFDLIEAVGVLHHMKDPEAGLRTLCRLLKPGGALKVGLYSKAARQAVNVARERFGGCRGKRLDEIRAVRREVITSDDPIFAPLYSFVDFYAASEFRDLVLHVEEHQVSLADIKDMLNRNGLKFLGFSNRNARAALRDMPVKSAHRMRRDLSKWAQYERRKPQVFDDMYQFICVKR